MPRPRRPRSRPATAPSAAHERQAESSGADMQRNDVERQRVMAWTLVQRLQITQQVAAEVRAAIAQLADGGVEDARLAAAADRHRVAAFQPVDADDERLVLAR